MPVRALHASIVALVRTLETRINVDVLVDGPELDASFK